MVLNWYWYILLRLICFPEFGMLTFTTSSFSREKNALLAKPGWTRKRPFLFFNDFSIWRKKEQKHSSRKWHATKTPSCFPPPPPPVTNIRKATEILWRIGKVFGRKTSGEGDKSQCPVTGGESFHTILPTWLNRHVNSNNNKLGAGRVSK